MKKIVDDFKTFNKNLKEKEGYTIFDLIIRAIIMVAAFYFFKYYLGWGD